MRKTIVLTAIILGVGLAAAGLVRVAAADQESGHGKSRMMGHHEMAGMGQHTMAFCPFMTPGAQIKVTSTPSGATIEVTASDPTAIARIQKKAQILQLMHELHALGPEHSHEGHESDQNGSHASDAGEPS